MKTCSTMPPTTVGTANAVGACCSSRGISGTVIATDSSALTGVGISRVLNGGQTASHPPARAAPNIRAVTVCAGKLKSMPLGGAVQQGGDPLEELVGERDE